MAFAMVIDSSLQFSLAYFSSVKTFPLFFLVIDIKKSLENKEFLPNES